MFYKTLHKTGFIEDTVQIPYKQRKMQKSPFRIYNTKLLGLHLSTP